MRDMLVLTVIGSDRKGLVQSLAERISTVGGNWEESRMARLAGQFAGILRITVDAHRTDELLAALRSLDAAGLQVTAQKTTAPTTEPAAIAIRVELTANDRPGIIRDVARILAERGLNVEELETEVREAPMSGEPLFTARAMVRAPASFQLHELRARLEALGGELMVDLSSE